MIKTWEEYCEETNMDSSILPDVSRLPEKMGRRTIARIKLELMTAHINPKDYVPNWDDWDEYKWIPVFYMGGSGGFRFYYSSAYYDVYAGAGAGSAFCLKTKSRSDHAGKYWVDLYKEAMS